MGEIYGCGADLGTAFLQSARDDGKGGVTYTEVRDCYRSIPYDDEFESQLRLQNIHFVRDGDNLYVLGNDAFLQAGMSEISIGLGGNQDKELLQRPMQYGVLNPSDPKISLIILRELVKACVEKDIGPARPKEILYFSVPAKTVDSDISGTFHEKMAQKHFEKLGFDARPLGEGMSVLFSENPQMHAPEGNIPYTGIAISWGAGQTNFALASRGIAMDEFSVCRGGDYIDSNAARMTGQPKTKIMRVKEKKLNFNSLDESDEILLAIDCYYQELVQYVFGLFAKRFSASKGSIPHPIDVVLSGGSACPPGFEKMVKKIVSRMSLPFEIAEIRLAGNGDQRKMLQATARGCYIRAKQAAKKLSAGKEVMDIFDTDEKK